MPKLKNSQQRTHLVGISSEGHAAQGIGLSSRQSEDFAIPTDWTTEETRLGSEVCIRYRSPTGQYFASRTAVLEFLACDVMLTLRMNRQWTNSDQNIFQHQEMGVDWHLEA